MAPTSAGEAGIEEGGMKKLKRLQEFNQEALGSYAVALLPRPNGIECPVCRKNKNSSVEMMDSDNIVLTSNPPQKNIHCPTCGYRGYRYC